MHVVAIAVTQQPEIDAPFALDSVGTMAMEQVPLKISLPVLTASALSGAPNSPGTLTARTLIQRAAIGVR
jgi:hypothetical protein